MLLGSEVSILKRGAVMQINQPLTVVFPLGEETALISKWELSNAAANFLIDLPVQSAVCHRASSLGVCGLLRLQPSLPLVDFCVSPVRTLSYSAV